MPNVDILKDDDSRTNIRRVKFLVKHDDGTTDKRWFTFTSNQVETERWRKHVKKQLEKDDEKFKLPDIK